MSKYCKSFKISDDPYDKPPCRGCSSYLTEPYIKCAECGPSHFLLCLQVNMSHTCHTHVTHMHECSQSHCLFLNLTILLMETFASSVSPGDLNTRSIKVITDMKSWYEIQVCWFVQLCTDCDFKFLFELRPPTSPYWSLDGRHRRKWLYWRPSWTAALETGEWPQIWISQSLLPAEKIGMTVDFDLFCKFVICWWRKSNLILLRWLIWCLFLHCRQDVAYQMRTKTKEECETHYMKNFINNPLFSSTLLSLRKTKDSHFAEGAIPFRRQCPLHLHSLFFLDMKNRLHLSRSYSWGCKVNIGLFICHSYSSVLKSGIALFIKNLQKFC